MESLLLRPRLVKLVFVGEFDRASPLVSDSLLCATAGLLRPDGTRFLWLELPAVRSDFRSRAAAGLSAQIHVGGHFDSPSSHELSGTRTQTRGPELRLRPQGHVDVLEGTQLASAPLALLVMPEKAKLLRRP